MNIRWDAVVDPAAVESSRAPPALPHPIVDRNSTDISVRVQLFGALAAVSSQRSFELVLPAGALVADVIAILGEQLGEIFSAQVVDAGGVKRRHCRLFVAGYPVENLQTPLYPISDLTEIDIILLIAPEGG
jgi:molybdopterin converting factor small subunit